MAGTEAAGTASPYTLAVVVADSPLRMESVAASGHRLFLGAADGTLVVYGPSAASSGGYDVLEMHRQFAPRAIVQIAVHEQLEMLVLLSDGLVHVHALGDLRRLAVLSALRGCVTLALTHATDAGDCLLAVSCRRKVHVLRWAPAAANFVDFAEVAIPDDSSAGAGGSTQLKAAVVQLTEAAKDGVITLGGGGSGGADGLGGSGGATLLIWLGAAEGVRELLVGTRREYHRFELATRELSTLFRTGERGGGGAAVGARVGPSEALLCQERIGCFVGLGGSPSRKYQLSFREPPLLVCASVPYVLSLHPARGAAGGVARSGGAMHVLEVRLLLTQEVIQTIALPALGGAPPSHLLCHPGDGRGRAEGAPMAEQPATVVTLGSGSLLSLCPLPLPELQRQLVLQRRYDEAARLCASVHGPGTPAEAAARRAIGQLRGYALLREAHFEAGCVQLAEARARPLAVLSLYAKLLPSGVPPERVRVRLLARGVEGAGGPGVKADDFALEVAPLVLAEQAQIVGLYTALRAFLERARRDPEILPREGQDAAAGASAGWMGEERAAAERTAADTALLKILLSVDQPALLPFLRQPNACILAESELVLLRYQQLEQLVGLWQGRGLHVKALELLLSLGQQEGQVSSALRGVRATVDYLRKLPASELEVVVRFSAWPLRCEPQEGLRIFCDPSDPPSSEPERASGIPLHTTAAAALRRGGPLPPDAVYEHICASAGPELALRFLECVLAHPGPSGALASARLHDELARGYLATIARLCAQAEERVDEEADDAQGAAPAAAELGGSASPRPVRTRAARAAELAAELAAVRLRCAAFLQTSHKVGAEHLLAEIGADSGPAARSVRALAPERALLLGKLGRHEAALRLLLREMADVPAAEAYCARVSVGRDVALSLAECADGQAPFGRPQQPSTDAEPRSAVGVYDCLLRVLLRPDGEGEEDLPAALALLRRHPDEVDALVALELLPADMPLAALSGWLHGSVSALRQGARAAQVERNLAKTDSLALRAQLGEERRQPVTIKPGTLCAVCGKRIGTTVFARYPSGIVAHFACSGENLHVCPVTREDFRRRAFSPTGAP